MRSSGGQLARSVVFISLQQVFARVVPFALHTFAKTSLDPAAASVRSQSLLRYMQRATLNPQLRLLQQAASMNLSATVHAA